MARGAKVRCGIKSQGTLTAESGVHPQAIKAAVSLVFGPRSAPEGTEALNHHALIFPSTPGVRWEGKDSCLGGAMNARRLQDLLLIAGTVHSSAAKATQGS